MFDLYLALGDSMSIDFYPFQDSEGKGVKCRQEIGAASLLYQNDSSLFPEFEGADLKSRYEKIDFVNLAVDGATSDDMLTAAMVKDISKLARHRVLATLTLGGNDLLHVYRNNRRNLATLSNELMELEKRYDTVVRTIKKRLPTSIIILTTIFDPTDGTGIMPSNTPIYAEALPIEYLQKFNDTIKACAEKHYALLADVHAHFRGHGAECGSAEQFWYWKDSPIEPSYRGASEIRRVWLDTINQTPSLALI